VWTSHPAAIWILPKWRFEVSQVFLASKTSTIPTHVPSIGFEQNESVPYQFRGIMFPYAPLFGTTTTTPTWFWFPFLWKGLAASPWWLHWQNPYLGWCQWHPNLPEYSSSIWIPLGYVLQLPLLNHKHMEVIHKNQKLLEWLFHLWNFLLLLFKRFVHNQMF
jgi:hypothetical protein